MLASRRSTPVWRSTPPSARSPARRPGVLRSRKGFRRGLARSSPSSMLASPRSRTPTARRSSRALAITSRRSSPLSSPRLRVAGRLPVRHSVRVLDPVHRWREHGEKPDYAGLLTFGSLPWTEDPADLEGVDVAVIGAPTDDLTSDRPGARFGPRAIRAAGCPWGPHLEAKVDASRVLRIVDYGDAP